MASNARASDVRLVGFIGKIPACGDFVRQHIGNKISTELERWLSASTQSLYAGKHELGSGSLRFVYSAAGCEDVAVGTLSRSVDSVGRQYPLAIFTSLSAAEFMAQPAALPLAYAPFFASAEQLLAELSSLPLESMRERVTGLTPPSPQELAAATQQLTTRLGAVDGVRAIQRALADQPESASYYALLTLCTASSVVQLGAANGAPTVLDCPLEPELGPALWLALTAARLRWTQGALSLLWAANYLERADLVDRVDQPSSQPRLLIALGYASDQLLSLYAAKLHTSTRLWPLTTERLEAVARARAQLEPQLPALQATEPVSVSELAAQVAKLDC